MSLESLNQTLALLATRYTSPERQQFQQLLQHWEEVVGRAIAAQTQPLSVQRGVLWVATSSSAWAQNLTFERQRILTQLNAHLPTPLTDIRFSPARWQTSQPATAPGTDEQVLLWQEHPSRLLDLPEAVSEAGAEAGAEPVSDSVPTPNPIMDSLPELPDPALERAESAADSVIEPGNGNSNNSDPQAAFQAWATRLRSRMQHLPLCPQCQCPTPPGELARWSLCAICAAKQW